MSLIHITGSGKVPQYLKKKFVCLFVLYIEDLCNGQIYFSTTYKFEDLRVGGCLKFQQIFYIML